MQHTQIEKYLLHKQYYLENFRDNNTASFNKEVSQEVIAS